MARLPHTIQQARVQGKRRLWLPALLVLALLIGLAAFWSQVPLRQWFHPGPWLDRLRPWANSPLAPLYVLAAYLAGSFLAVPIVGLFLPTFLLFGPIAGFGYCLAGALISGAVVHGIGRRLGREALAERLEGTRLEVIRRRLSRQGILTMAIVRVLPVAPFSVVNLVAGASGIRLRYFLLGSTLGLVPGLIALALLEDRLEAVLRQPTWGTLAAFLACIGAIILAAAAFQSRYGDALESDQPDPRPPVPEP